MTLLIFPIQYYPIIHLLFSLPELKTHQNLSVIRRLCCRCRELFTFLSSSPEPLGQFHQIWHGDEDSSLFKWKRALFQAEIITKWRKYSDKIYKSSSPEPLGQFQPNLALSILAWRLFNFVQMQSRTTK